MSSYSVERNSHPSSIFPNTKGYRHAADFKIDFVGMGIATVVLTLLWNESKTLVPGTNQTNTTIIDASMSISKSGTGWAVIGEIAGEEPWIDFKNTIIRFRKRFTVELPTAPALSQIPKLGDLAKELGATTTTRIQAEGVFDVVSYVNKMQSTVY